MADVQTVLQRCDPVLLDPCRGVDRVDTVEAAGMLLCLTDSRRMQKVLWRQLFVLDSMMSLLEGLESSQQLLTQSCPPQPDGGARGRWKALKLENKSRVEETEALLISLEERIQKVHDRRHTLTQLLQKLQSKKQQCDQLEESLQKAQSALQVCDSQLTQLRAEAEAALGNLLSWQRLRDELRVYVSTAQDAAQIDLVSFSQSELCLEMRPRPPAGTKFSSNEPEPLKLSVTWSHDDRFRLQVGEGTAGLVEDFISDRRSELSAALQGVMQCYVSQADLLSEIQGLRSNFAIDWCPAKRLLTFLKSASLVCHLEVEEGYPTSGRARLLSVRHDGQPVETSALKPPKADLSLTEWLVFLHCSDLI